MLIRTFGMLRRVMDPYFVSHGVSGSQWGVLRALHRAEEEGRDGMRLSDLGDRLIIRPPSVTGVVDRLERQGLLHRTRLASGDQRARQVSLTPLGRQRVARVLKGMGEQVESVLAPLTPDERRELQQLLEKLYLHLGKMSSTPLRAIASDVETEEDRTDS